MNFIGFEKLKLLVAKFEAFCQFFIALLKRVDFFKLVLDNPQQIAVLLLHLILSFFALLIDFLAYLSVLFFLRQSLVFCLKSLYFLHHLLPLAAAEASARLAVPFPFLVQRYL